jgi:hypothetical protein
MKIGKYHITVRKKDIVWAVFNYAFTITLFILFTENNGKRSCEIAFFTCFIPFVWNVLWFNYYEIKKQNKEQNVQVSDTTKVD